MLEAFFFFFLFYIFCFSIQDEEKCKFGCLFIDKEKDLVVFLMLSGRNEYQLEGRNAAEYKSSYQ